MECPRREFLDQDLIPIGEWLAKGFLERLRKGRVVAGASIVWICHSWTGSVRGAVDDDVSHRLPVPTK
jgi:hypothetical protein